MLAVTLVRDEVAVAVVADVAPQSLPSIQEPELGPEIHQSVGGRGSGPPDHAGDGCPTGSQCFEALGGVGFEGAELVDHHHVYTEKASLLVSVANVACSVR